MNSTCVSFFLIILIIFSGCSLLKTSSKEIPKPKLTRIEGGTFIMGDIYGGNNPDAMPVHKVTLQYEVTYKEYDAFAHRTNRPVPSDDSLGRGQRAVVYVNWDDAKTFCEFHGWRLPTEQEWEYAARGGGQKMRYAGTNNVDSLNHYARTTSNSTQTLGNL